MKKVFFNSLKILVSILLLYFVFQKIPFRQIAKVWSSVEISYVVLSAIFFLGSQILSAKRLGYYLNANNFELPFKSNLQLYFIGMFYNFFIPGGIGGDAYKVYILNKKFGWSVKNLTSALFTDRLSGLLAIITLIPIFSVFLPQNQYILLIALIIFTGLIILFFITKKLFRKYKNIFFKTFLISVTVQILQIICFTFLMMGLGVDNNFLIYIILFLISSVLSLVSFAGIGIREMLFLKASEFFDFHASYSVSASLLFTAITALFSLAGLFFMSKKSIKIH